MDENRDEADSPASDEPVEAVSDESSAPEQPEQPEKKPHTPKPIKDVITPVTVVNQTDDQPTVAATPPPKAAHHMQPRISFGILGQIIVLIVVAMVVYYWQHAKVNNLTSKVSGLQATVSTDQNGAASAIQSNHFQAVFLDGGVSGGSGQVLYSTYFGHLSAVDTTTYELSDVYYLSTPNSSGNEQLIKLGSAQLHMPEDVMYISKANVAFWENLQNANQFNGQLK